MFEDGGALIACLAGLIGGVVLGAAARLGRFCMMASVEDAVYGEDTGGLRMLALAAATAITATAVAAALGWFAPEASLYLRTGWSPAASVLGGLMFGFGMAQVGTCGFGALSRAGGGDLRGGVMALVVGIAAYAAMAGPLAPLIAAIHSPAIATAPLPSLGEWLGAWSGIGTTAGSLLFAGALAAVALRGGALSTKRAAWGMAVGLAVSGAWVLTTLAGGVGFEPVPVQSFSFTAPLGDAVLSAMTGSAAVLPAFGVASVIGVLAGAAGASWLRGDSRWEACDDARELRRQVGGAVLMGVGGVMALGCTVGQGLSALSVLSVSAPVTIVSLLAGARFGLFQLVERTT